MAEEIISVVDIASKGVVIDTPPVALGQNIFTDVKNVRFKDGAVRKIEGELLLNDITGVTGQARYIAVWENPNLQPTGVYYLWVVDKVVSGITVGQQVYIQDHTGVKRDITPAGLNSGNGFSFTTSGWQHTLFSGGFTFILNNGIDKPYYILDTAGNTDINNLVLAELPGWDSYHVEQTIVDDVFSAGVTNVFDLGQNVDFIANEIVVTGTNNKSAQAGTPAGTGTVNGTDFVPGIYPSTTPTVTGNNFQIYIDSATNTTVLVVGGLTINDEIKVNIESRNPVNVRAGIVESFGNLLVAGDLTETDGANIIRRLSGVVRTSDVAVPGSVPNNWNPFAAGVSTADEFTLSETNVIQEMKSLQGNMYIYSTDSIHVMRLTGRTAAPVAFSPVTDEYGCLVKGAVKEYDGKHLVVGSNDIYVFSGNPGTMQSLAQGRIKEYFYNNLNPIHERQLFLLQNHPELEIWVCYPTLSSTSGECDEALIWNYRDNTWTIRELNSVASGDVGPIRGGGIPTATIAATGNSGNAGYTNRGLQEVQSITINGKTPRRVAGAQQIYTLTNGLPSTASIDKEEIIEIWLDPTDNNSPDTGPNVVNAKSTITTPTLSTTQFKYDRNGTTYLDGGASYTLVGDATIGTVSIPAILAIGNAIPDNSIVTFSDFKTYIVNYINNNFALSDWVATITGPEQITLTSVVPGPRLFTNPSCILAISNPVVGSPITHVLQANSAITGVGVYGISAAESPAISMRITAPESIGVHAAIDETITFDTGLDLTEAVTDNAVLKLQQKAVFNGDANSIYSVSRINSSTASRLEFTSTKGGSHTALTITYFTTYNNVNYLATEFGGSISSNTFIAQSGTTGTFGRPTFTVNFPNGDTSTFTLSSATDIMSAELIGAALAPIITANANWVGSKAVGNPTVTATAAAIGSPDPVAFTFSAESRVGRPLPAELLSTNAGFQIVSTQTGLPVYDTTDTIILTPPIGNGTSVTFNDLVTYPAYDPPTQNTAEITAIEIATALEAAWTDTTYFTVARTNEVLTFTAVNRGVVSGEFNYTVSPGNTRAGTTVTPLISNSTAGDISVIEGIDKEFAKMTRVTITLNTAAGSVTAFDRHYGEGPGRLLDPNFTPAANDDTYGDTGVSSDAEYLALYYNPDATQDAAELAKDNGEVSTMQSALLAALVAINTNNALIVTPDNSSTPTSIDIGPSQFSTAAQYVLTYSPFAEAIPASVAPTTTALVAVAEGNTVAAGAPTQSTAGTSISTTFNVVRPWAVNQINPNKVYPVFVQSGYDSGTLFNRIRAADLTYTFDGTPYVSYIERQQMSITPNFDTETINSISLWADGGTATVVGGALNRATLQLRARGTNYPGEPSYLTVAEDNTQSNTKANKLTVNNFVVANSYKTDIRITGRFLNYRVDDALADTSSGYTSTNASNWNISGLQLGISKGGVK